MGVFGAPGAPGALGAPGAPVQFMVLGFPGLSGLPIPPKRGCWEPREPQEFPGLPTQPIFGML